MPDVLGTQGGLIHHLCLERNQDLVPIVWSHTLKRKQYLKVDGDGASAEMCENMGMIVK